MKGPPTTGDREAVRALAAVPGISESRAKDLVAHGFHDFADIVRLALPEGAIRHGLHHAIARKVMLADLEHRYPMETTDARCPMCGTAWVAGAVRCAACGSPPDLDPTAIERKLVDLAGEVVDLTTDEDFRNMPEDIRRDLLQASGEITQEDLRDESPLGMETWQGQNVDIDPIEQLFQGDPDSPGENGDRIIGHQVVKDAEAGGYRCPLCDIRLEVVGEECENCGARFG